ncbi:GPI transamidase component [Ascosphaera acerosa]|nr:GPI transamidase component [Ascosphaera acerosa]
MWWKTTTVHREAIPTQEMLDWASGRVCRPVFPLQIIVNAPEIQAQEAEALLQMAQQTLDDLNDFPTHHLRLQLNQTAAGEQRAQTIAATPDTALVVELLADQDDRDTAWSTLAPATETLRIHYPPIAAFSTTKLASGSSLAAFLASEVQSLFAEEKASIAYSLLQSGSTLGSVTLAPGTSGQPSASRHSGSPGATREQRSSVVKSLDPVLVDNLARRKMKAFKYAETYHLSISVFTPGPLPSSWDIEGAIEEDMLPMLAAFAPISNFTIDTQVQVYATFSDLAPEPVYDAHRRAWYLRREHLGSFVNAAEWPLSPSIGAGPTINFIVYVPAASQSPLYISGVDATSWTVPQWGGLYILNVPKENADLLLDMPAENPAHLTKEALRPAMRVFCRQLLTLLGVPSSPASLPLRLKSLIRIHIAALLLSASSTMGSLARLTQSLVAMPIPPTVADAVATTLAHLSAGCEHLREGRFLEALAAARVAEAEAEKGFFDKSMVAQAYFPDEHKIAVYLPFLGPVGVPLVIGLLKEVKRLVTQFRSRQGS